MIPAPLVHEVEAALLARGALRRGRHLRLRCLLPGHTDAHPSCDYDPAAHVWVCRSCGRGGGLRELAELLGVTPPPGIWTRRRRAVVPPSPAGVTCEVWAEAWSAVVDMARRRDRRLAPHRDVFQIADWLRPRHQLVSDARRVASGLGDTPHAWRLLGLAARVMTTTMAVEDDLDAVRRYVA